MSQKPIIIIGAGLAGLSAGIALCARGMPVTIIEKEANVGGKMRQQTVGGQPIDAGPTVMTMKWVFDDLFGMVGSNLDSEVELTKATTLARHAWNGTRHFDLFADAKRAEQEVGEFFNARNAIGFRRFCADSAAAFDTLKDTYISAPCPSPTQLAQRVGFANTSKLFGLKPFHSLWRALSDYFPDPRLRQLFGRYATYVGSSPYLAPATLMLIAHVEQSGVWFLKGGMHSLASAMAKSIEAQGGSVLCGADVEHIILERSSAKGVMLSTGERMEAAKVLYCGDISRLSPRFFKPSTAAAPQKVPADKRSLSAITWTAIAKTKGFELKRHNVFFSSNYRREFDQIFKQRQVPSDPTVYICAQDQEGEKPHDPQSPQRLLCLINAPGFGDRRRLDEEEISKCLQAMLSRLKDCGLTLNQSDMDAKVTQPADFDQLFPGSGGALYGRASHGWMASFARPGTQTKIPGLYLAGGSVHPGAGVPMATLSGMLAAEQMIKDRALT
ncbi:MAG: 1-hydroxycarotenoid 3,4-desaturase CrtD [Pseudomonadota bacterium]